MIRQRVIATGTLIAAVAAGAVGGAVLGVPSLSGAQGVASTTTTVPHPHFGMRFGGGPLAVADSSVFDAAAKALNLTPQQLRAKLSDGKTTIADVAGQQKVPVDTVIAAMDAASHQQNSKIVNTPWPQPPAFGSAPGPGSAFAPKLAPGSGGGILGASVDAVAKALNITPAELKADLAKGMTIADIAKSKNIPVDTVINTLVNDATARINQAVQDKKLTQDQANKLEQNLKTAITNIVNNGLRFRGGFAMHGPNGGFGSGRMGGGMPAPPAAKGSGTA